MMFLLNNNDGCMSEPELRDGMKFEDHTTEIRHAKYMVYSDTCPCIGYVIYDVLGNANDSDNRINAVKSFGFNPSTVKADFIKFVDDDGQGGQYE